ncbi:MAG TPA: COX15/CtaA family protein [Pirellulaceae bacterium]|nr:COX15/CtaA family protein [Pirellulaceae bacterium]
MPNRNEPRPSPWPHRLAVTLALVTFPLIWVGGLVTTYDAGMAVPDWPGTYGYNLLLYPWQSWLAAPWDLFIEHGHRLLGSAAGLVSIVLLAVVLLVDRRRWLLLAAIGALALVIVQGVLGGARVLFDERLVALLHGCVGPLFFAYVGALAVATSKPQDASVKESAAGRNLLRAAAVTAALAYVQLVLGALVRHVPLTASPQVFRAALLLHLVVGGVLAVQIVLTAARAWSARAAGGVAGPGLLLPVLVAVQIALGLATYVAKYSWPAWLGDYAFAASFVVQEKSLAQSLITTAHVAGGSLILFTAVVLAARSVRLFGLKAAISGHALDAGTSAAIGRRLEWRAV